MDHLPSLNPLRAFEAVAWQLSFIRVAEELSVTKGAVSHHVHHLEQGLGIALLSRIPSHLTLTPEGETLYLAAGIWCLTCFFRRCCLRPAPRIWHRPPGP